MSTDLLPVFIAAKKMLSNGISVIPVFGKGHKKAKSPSIDSWKSFQNEKITEDDLFKSLNKNKVPAIAAICGRVSNNLEVIDVDVKNWYGIDAIYFKAIQDIYPSLWDKLFIVKTLNGGFHIYIRVSSGTIPGNKKLCCKKDIKEAAIETRGEGGYVLAPPSDGYTIFKDNEIPILTWNERCSLIALAESLSESVKEAVKDKIIKTNSDYYNENPFDHYNGSDQGANILQSNGWELLKKSGQNIYYQRPQQEEKGRIGASFHVGLRIFYFFTSSTEFKHETGYNPSQVLSIISFNGDNKKTFAHLVNSGFGKIKPEKEKLLAVSRAKRGLEIPNNISEEGKKIYEETKIQLKNDHPFGTFWEYDEKSKVCIDRESLEKISIAMGYLVYDDELVNISDGFIYKKTELEYYKEIKKYIKEEDNDIFNALSIFAQHNIKWIISILPILNDELILKDSREMCFKLFKNGVVVIDNKTIELHQYAEVDLYIWYDKIQPRDFVFFEGGKYVDFLEKSIGITDSLKQTIGFLTHEYKDETTANIIVLSEVCLDPKDGGGSGKNVFCDLLKLSTTYTSKPGAQAKFDEKFFQSWNGQKIFAISDVPKHFDFSFLKEPSSGSFIHKLLFKNETIIPVEKAPKLIVQTNYSYEIIDGGLRRRIVPIEFTTFFTNAGGIDKHYGCLFPKGWSEEDYNGYDTFIARCILKWLKSGLTISRLTLSDGGWIKQFEQTYGPIILSLVQEYWDKWVEMGKITNEDFNQNCESFYKENTINIKYHPSSNKINKAIIEYGNNFKIDVKVNYVSKVNGICIKHRIFNVKE